MLQDEESGQRELSSTQESDGGAESMPHGAEPELKAISSAVLGNRPLQSDDFGSHKWHRAYAEALMEAEPAKRTRLIAYARRAILERYLELCLMPASVEEGRDLFRAVAALSELDSEPKTRS